MRICGCIGQVVVTPALAGREITIREPLLGATAACDLASSLNVCGSLTKPIESFAGQGEQLRLSDMG
jgi:hypothetical protein